MKFNLSRSTIIKTELSSLRDHLADLRNWPLWSPWLVTEPDAEISFAENGSHQTWKGELVGEGSLTVKNVQDNLISYNLHFLKPFASKATTSFVLRDNNNGSVHLTWIMNGNLPWFMFFAKNFMASVVGMDYDRGLLMLKKLIETGKIHSSLTKPKIDPFNTIHYVGITTKACPLAELASHQPQYEKIASDIASIGKPLQALSIYHSFALTSQLFDFTAGFIVNIETANAMKNNAHYTVGSIQGGDAIRITHTGSYNHLGNAWSAAMSFSRYKKRKIRKETVGIEIYTHMDENNPNAHITEILAPLR